MSDNVVVFPVGRMDPDVLLQKAATWGMDDRHAALRVVPGGADYQLIVADGTLSHLDARYVIETHDGVRLVVFNTAIRYTTKENALRIMQGQAVDPAAVYFRCQPRMESTHAAYDWLNHTMMVGTGVRKPDGVFLSFYRY